MEIVVDGIPVKFLFHYHLSQGIADENVKKIVREYKSGIISEEVLDWFASEIRRENTNSELFLLPIPSSSEERYRKRANGVKASLIRKDITLFDGADFVRYFYDRKPLHKTGYRGPLSMEHIVLDKKVKGKDFILFDDVVTTGTTISCLKEKIEKAGGRVICAYAIARAEDTLKHNNETYKPMNWEFKTTVEVRERFLNSVYTSSKVTSLGLCTRELFLCGMIGTKLNEKDVVDLAGSQMDVSGLLVVDTDKFRKIIKKLHLYSDEELGKFRDSLSNPLYGWLDGRHDERVNVLIQYKDAMIRLSCQRLPDKDGNLKVVDLSLVGYKKVADEIVRSNLKGGSTYINHTGLTVSPIHQYLSDVSLKPVSDDLMFASISFRAFQMSRIYHLPENIKVCESESSLSPHCVRVSSDFMGQYEPLTDRIWLNYRSLTSHLIKDPDLYSCRVINHECVGHYGLRRLLGKRFEKIMCNVYDHSDSFLKIQLNHRENELKNAVATDGKKLHDEKLYTLKSGTFHPSDEWKVLVAEEYISYTVEKMGELPKHDGGAWNRFCDIFCDGWRSILVGLPFHTITSEDVDWMIRMSYDKIRSQSSIADRVSFNPIYRILSRFSSNHTHTALKRENVSDSQNTTGPVGSLNKWYIRHHRLRWITESVLVGFCISNPSLLPSLPVLCTSIICYESYRGVNQIVKRLMSKGAKDERYEQYPGARITESHLKREPSSIDKQKESIQNADKETNKSEAKGLSPFSKAEERWIMDLPEIRKGENSTCWVVDKDGNATDITSMIETLEKWDIDLNDQAVLCGLAYHVPFETLNRDGQKLSCYPEKDVSGHLMLNIKILNNHEIRNDINDRATYYIK